MARDLYGCGPSAGIDTTVTSTTVLVLLSTALCSLLATLCFQRARGQMRLLTFVFVPPIPSR